MRNRTLCVAAPPLFACCLVACGLAEEMGGSDSESQRGPAFGVGSSTATGDGAGMITGSPVATSGGGGATPPLPAEVELSFAFELPAAGERYVFAANPESDTVAVIDANTLGIQAVEAGDRPTFLQTLAGEDAAVVLNVGSSDATIVRTRDGESTVATVDVQTGANAIAVSPDGRRAVVYFDAAYRGAGATGSYQDISVLFLDEGDERSVAMTVGFRPSSVSFSADGAEAFVVTEDGVSVLDLAEVESKGPHVARTVPLGSDATASLDVSVTPDGRYALARREGESVLRLADLTSGDVHLLDLAANFTASTPGEPEPSTPESDAGPGDVTDAGAPVTDTPVAPASAPIPAAVTDVDLAPSGVFALAAVRDRGSVLRVPIPGAFLDDADVTVISIASQVVGSVTIAPDSASALVYTTAVATDERISVLDLASEEYRSVRLPKAVQSVTISGEGQTALIVHQKLPGNPDEAGLDPDVVLDRSYGYSVLDMESGFSKLQTARTQVGPSTIVPGATDLFVLFNDPSLGISEVHQVDLGSFLVERIALGSPPNSIGAVPGSKKVFVGQEHQDGRIAFIDWETGEIESVTGFELNSRIRE